jgi:hypothetical protein
MLYKTTQWPLNLLPGGECPLVINSPGTVQWQIWQGNQLKQKLLHSNCSHIEIFLFLHGNKTTKMRQWYEAKCRGRHTWAFIAAFLNIILLRSVGGPQTHSWHS